MLKTLLALSVLITLSPLSAHAFEIYEIDVLDGTDGNEFGFSTPAETVRIPPHPEGLVVRFRNLTAKNVVIHGEGLIPHQDPSQPMPPQGTFELPAILPGDGDNLPGYYTIHDVYTPERNVIFNATSEAR